MPCCHRYGEYFKKVLLTQPPNVYLDVSCNWNDAELGAIECTLIWEDVEAGSSTYFIHKSVKGKWQFN